MELPVVLSRNVQKVHMLILLVLPCVKHVPQVLRRLFNRMWKLIVYVRSTDMQMDRIWACFVRVLQGIIEME